MPGELNCCSNCVKNNFLTMLLIIFSPLIGVVKRKHIAISRAQPRIEAKIDVKLLGGSTEEILVKARLDVDSGIRFTETYESASVLGQTVDIPEALQYSRDLYVSYVDEDVLVVRDGSGVPEILVRK